MILKLKKIKNRITRELSVEGIQYRTEDMTGRFYLDGNYRLPINVDMEIYEEEQWYKTIVEIILYNVSRITYIEKTIKIKDELLV